MELLLLASLAALQSWQYAKASVDPDWAYFNLGAFTGSLYGRDFVDCKTPGVHFWYWLLAKLVGTDVVRVRFAYHFTFGLVALALWAITGNFLQALVFLVIVNSGWLLAFHGNVGQVPAALIALSLAIHDPTIQAILWIATILYEPKLLLSCVFVAGASGWGSLFLLVAGIAPLLAIGLYANTQWFRKLWESSVTIPLRISRMRRPAPWMPWFTSKALLFLLPWLAAAIYSRPDWVYWAPAVLYMIVTCWGLVVRPNHLLPLAAWIAMAGVPAPIAAVLIFVELVTCGLYLGDVWLRWYPALAEPNRDARRIGEWLKGRPGEIFLNGLHSAVYIYARKRIALGMAEQVEIREVASERNQELVERWRATPPDWVVQGDVPGIRFTPKGYAEAIRIGNSIVYAKR